jgi:two-component system response regulator TctD
MRVLLVEDNRQLSEWLKKTLIQSGYKVDTSLDGDEANYLLKTQSYDLVILDLSLPKINGEEILRRYRLHENEVPVLILTADNSIRTKVDILNIGADDFVSKPFDINELEARMRVLLRRSKGHINPIFSCGNLFLNTNTKEFWIEDLNSKIYLKFTKREYSILENMLLNIGKTVSKMKLANSIFSIDDYASEDSIEIYVHRIRKKLIGSRASIITLRGHGYVLKDDE